MLILPGSQAVASVKEALWVPKRLLALPGGHAPPLNHSLTRRLYTKYRIFSMVKNLLPSVTQMMARPK